MLKTLHDAGHYAAARPKAVQERVEWQTAAEMLIPAALGQRSVMFAEIAMRKALGAAETTASTSKPRRKPATKRYKIVR